MKPSTVAFGVVLCASSTIALSTAAIAALKPGDTAPPFVVEAALGGTVSKFSLTEALGKGPVVLYFYPKSFTSVCTLEAHDFADNIENFKDAGASVIGLSGDKIEVQSKFSSMECRDKFPVGADPDLAVSKSYDAALTVPGYGAAFANRISYVIAPDGKILWAYSDPDGEAHITNALKAVRLWHDKQKR